MSATLVTTENDRTITLTATVAWQTVFSFDFPVQFATDLLVEVASVSTPDAWTPLSYASAAYSVSGVGEVAGGSVTLAVGRAVGDRVRISGETPASRAGSVVAAGRFSSDAIDADLDRSRMIEQELRRTTKSLAVRVVASEEVIAARDTAVAAAETALALVTQIGSTLLQGVLASAVALLTVGAVDAIRTVGYASTGDRGDALYRRVSAEPSHLGKLQSADGHWFEICGPVFNLRAFGAGFDGTDDGPKIQSCLDLASGMVMYAPKANYRQVTPVVVRGNMCIYGDHYDADVAAGETWELDGTVFLVAGTGPKTQYARGVTDERTSGGVIDNAADADFGATDAKLSLASYYNEDAHATSGAPATPKAFSAAWTIGYGAAGVQMQDIRIILDHDGVAGYNDKRLSLGADWDVGLYVDNARYSGIRRVQVLGHWRLDGALTRCGALATETVALGDYAGCEELHFDECVFQGWKSFGLRGIGLWKVLAVTSTYIEIPWAANHPFDISNGYITIGEFSPRHVAVTGVSVVAGRLRFATSTDQTAYVSVGDPAAPDYYGNGCSGFRLRDCRMHGMWHASGRRISDPAITGAMAPSGCLEISGARVRGPRFEGCKVQGVDDIGVHLHQCLDVVLGPSMRFEGATPTGGAAGMRILTTPGDAVAYPNVVRPTYKLQLHAEQAANADFTPQFGVRPAKFGTDGWFAPTYFGWQFLGGIYVGDPTTNALFREYSIGNYTPVISFETPGNLAVTSQTRVGVAEVCGEYCNFYMRLTATLTHTTASGNLTVSLPKTIFNSANIFAAMQCIASNVTYPSGRTQLSAEGQPGTATAFLAATGSAVAKSYITAANIPTGTAVTLEISGSYRIQR